jgi:hypothetical protein
MKLEIYKTLWGHPGSLTSALHLAREAHFHGIEAPAPADESTRETFFATLSNTPWIAEVTTCTPEGQYLPTPHLPPAAHLASLEQKILHSLPGRPQFITTMAGSDEWDFPETLQFHQAILDLEQKHQIPISVETHRGRPTFNPWTTQKLLEKLPALRLTCDFSHWCVVTERLLLDEHPALLDLCAQHVHHIHARVGYAQGPQVPDPRAPEYTPELTAHLRWWRTLIAARQEPTTLTPEAGPDGYLHLAPYTQTPVADLWQINRFIAQQITSSFP